MKADEVEEKYRSRLVKAATALRDMQARIDRMRQERTEPIAVIGLGCRFPGGADDPESYWRLLAEGRDAVSRVPAAREGQAPTSDAGRWGAFLPDVEGFDAAFFGIAPREAAQLDPQQRLLLEVAWEALEHAGIDPGGLAGTDTGVFAGLTNADYLRLSAAAGAPVQNAYTGTGTTHCFGPGRISYLLGLRGPSLAVDTACSSSLVAVHLAMRSLRDGESSLALAGGVNLMLTPSGTEIVADLQALSPDGRCRAFDARANGFVRGEGCGFVVLKRLTDAIADGDRVWAVLRGSAVNHDGRSAGLTAPNVDAQRAMLRRALADARVTASDIGLVETHGTGTALGDPIEIEALADVFGAPASGGTGCALGAVKTNIGHLEAAAGVAGLIKAVLALRYETVPANLHFRTLNPRISLEGTPFVVPVRAMPWPAGDRPRLAGVSSFGMSGTNAHVIVEEAPAVRAPGQAGDGAVIIPLSARDPAALPARAAAYAGVLERAETPEGLRDIGYTAGARRAHHEHRLAVVADSPGELAASLRAFAVGRRPKGIALGRATGRAPAVTFVFSGQGSQWVGMSRELYAGEPVFRAALQECDALVSRHASFSILDELAAPEPESRLRDTEVVQPVLFGLQVALCALLSSWGIRPGAVIGHSVGEIAAAHIGGALVLKDAARLVVLRGRIMSRAAGTGGMVSAATDLEEIHDALRGHEDDVAVAAVNGGSTVLSGAAGPLHEVVARLRDQGVHCRPLDVDYAFHSPLMAPFAAELQAELGQIESGPMDRPMYSTVTGERVGDGELDPRYWAANVARPVRLADAVATAVAAGHRVFLEVGPHSVLTGDLEKCLADGGVEGRAVPTLRRGRPERRCLLQSVAALYAAGVPVRFAGLYTSPGGVISLPAYPWQRRRHWLPAGPPAAPGDRAVAADGGRPGRRRDVAGLTAVFESLATRETLDGHPRRDVPGGWVVADSALLDLALAAAQAAGPGKGRSGRVRDLTILRPLTLPGDGARSLQVVLSAPADDGIPLAVHGRSGDARPGEPWTTHLGGQAVADDRSGRPWDRWESVRERRGSAVPDDDASTLPHGTAGLWFGDGEAWCRLEPSRDPAGVRHGLLRAALRTALRAIGARDADTMWQVLAVEDLMVASPGDEAMWAHAEVRRPGGESPVADVVVVDESGTVHAELRGLRLSPIPADPAPEAHGTDTWVGRLLELPPPERLERMEAAVRADIATVLELDAPADLPGDQELSMLGMDSLMAVSLRHELARRTGRDLPATLAFEYPTVRLLSEYLLALVTTATNDTTIGNGIS